MPVTEMETPWPEFTLTLVTCRVMVFSASLKNKVSTNIPGQVYIPLNILNPWPHKSCSSWHQPWLLVAASWNRKQSDDLLRFMRQNVLPEMTNASLGPQVTKPQVILSPDKITKCNVNCPQPVADKQCEAKDQYYEAEISTDVSDRWRW